MDRGPFRFMCYRSLCLLPPIEIRIDSNKYERLCFMGYLYFPLLPDLKILIQFKEKTGKALNKLYRFQGSFWKGTTAQFRVSDRAINILCITIIPVAFSIHTVTSWLFATTYRPGWDSTNF